MHALLEQVAQCGMDHALHFDARLAGEGGAFDHQAEMGFARRVVAAVPAVLLAVIDQRQDGRRQRRLETAAHLGGDRSGGSFVHWLYI